MNTQLPDGFRKFASPDALAKHLGISCAEAVKKIIFGALPHREIPDGFLVADADLAQHGATFSAARFAANRNPNLNQRFSIRLRCSKGGLFG